MSGAQPTEVPLAEQICRERRGAPLVFVAIYSGLPNAARRQVLRETWLQLLPPGTRYKFFLESLPPVTTTLPAMPPFRQAAVVSLSYRL